MAMTIEALRESMGLSRRDFSELLGISERTVHRWEVFGVSVESTAVRKTAGGHAHRFLSELAARPERVHARVAGTFREEGWFAAWRAVLK
jgi:DNA-binding transcriptional regulator YiaG